MSKLVPTEEIESVVGATRHQILHIGRAVTETETLYLLHPHSCKDTGIDLRECEYSLAMDMGIATAKWEGYFDRPVFVEIEDGKIVPVPHFSPIDLLLSKLLNLIMVKIVHSFEFDEEELQLLREAVMYHRGSDLVENPEEEAVRVRIDKKIGRI